MSASIAWSLHLLLALVIYGALLWCALDCCYPARLRMRRRHRLLRRHGWIMMAVITFEIAIGGFVAGLDGGLVYNNFPMMGEHWIAPDLFAPVALVERTSSRTR